MLTASRFMIFQSVKLCSFSDTFEASSVTSSFADAALEFSTVDDVSVLTFAAAFTCSTRADELNDRDDQG